MARVTLKNQGELVSFLSAGKADIRSLKVYFSPKQSGTGDPSPENVREISGWTGVEVKKRGKNLVDIQDMKATYPWSIATYKPYRLFIGANKTVTISYSSTLTGGYGFYFVIGSNYEQRNSSTGTWMYHKNGGSYIKRNITVTTDDNGYIYLKLYVLNDAGLQDFYKYILDANFQVEYGTEVTSYEPYTGTTHTIDWTDTLGTIYGGYVDLISGEVVEEWGIIASYNGESLASEWLSDRDVYVSGTTPTIGAQVAYELATPTTHQLTPTEIQTITGQNTFWSNVDSIEVEYDLIETRDTWMRRRNIIAVSQPHLKSITGTSLRFETDMTSNLKECKIHFTPIQEGTGDPSPDNVRPIHGYDSITVYNGQTAVATIPFPQTIYGGYVDLVKGEVVETTHYTVLDGENIKVNKSYFNSGVNTGYVAAGYVYCNPSGKNSTVRFCDRLTRITTGKSITSTTPIPILRYANSGVLFVIIVLGKMEDHPDVTTGTQAIAAVNEWLKNNPVGFTYDLTAPTTYPLDPVTIRTLKGLNNIWSDANGNIELKFWTH